jgi:hypothetical protein
MSVGLHFNPLSLSNELRPIFLNNWSMIDNKAKEQTQSPRTLSENDKTEAAFLMRVALLRRIHGDGKRRAVITGRSITAPPA